MVITASKIFFYFCLSFIVGVFVSSVFAVLLDFSFSKAVFLFICVCLAIFGIILISVFWSYKKVVIAGFCFIFFAFGFFIHQNRESEIKNNELKKYNNLTEDIVFTGVVVKEPDIREKSIKLTIGDIQIPPYAKASGGKQNYEDIPRRVNGKILATVSRYPEYKYGDKLKITGELETPGIFDGFNYKDYLEKDGIYSVIYLPKIEFLGNQTDRVPVSAISGKKSASNRYIFAPT